MSDRTPCNYCDGWEGDHVVDCPAPLSPIALDFEAKLDAISTVVWAMPKEHKAEFRSAVKAVREAHIALVARVAQEEREKVWKEVVAYWDATMYPKYKGTADDPIRPDFAGEKQKRANAFKVWLDSHLRGTP